MTTVILIGTTIIALIVSLVKDKKKTFKAIKGAKNMMKNMISDIVAILFLIGLALAIVPAETIERLIGNESSLLATVGAATVGTITLIPAFVAFPLIGSLKDNGAGIVTLTAFLTTLTMVGFMTFPLEIKNFGKKFTIKRNALSFAFAILIALCVGVVL